MTIGIIACYLFILIGLCVSIWNEFALLISVPLEIIGLIILVFNIRSNGFNIFTTIGIIGFILAVIIIVKRSFSMF